MSLNMEIGNIIKTLTKNRNYILFTIAIFASFAIFGFSENVRSTAFPRIQEEFAITELHIGLLLAINSIGYVTACSYTAALAKKIGIKTCMVLTHILMAISGIGIFFSQSYLMLAASFFVLNLGYGMAEISNGIVAATIYTKYTGTMLNLAHFSYGAGAVFAPVAATSLMAVQYGDRLFGWRYMYIIILSFALMPAIPALLGRLKKQDYNKKKTGYALILKKRSLWLTVMILTFGVISEIGIAAWLVGFLEKAYSFPEDQAALRMTLYFVCFTIARLLLGPLIDKIGFINSLVFSAAFAGAMITIGVLIGEAGTPLLVLAGIGTAPVFPTVMAVIAKLFQDEIDLAITSVTTIMGIILVPANLLFGGIIDLLRQIFTDSHGEAGVGMAYSAGFMIVGLCCFASSTFALLLRKRQKKAGQLV